MKMTRRNFLSASALTLLSCQLAPAARADCLLSDLFHGADTALPPKPLTAKVMDANPFMGRSESNIHHDCYNTDSTDAILPVGICPEVNVAMEKTNPNASPAIFFDNFDNPVSPFLGGLAIRDLDAEEVRTIGFFSPAKHDGGGYLIQSSYSFVDGRNLIVCPTSHNHVLMLRATDEKGTPLPVFEKVLDINIKEAAERVLGRSLEQNLLSIVFDYDGNLWFATGGFRIYPSRGQQGAMGYISHNAIETILAGGTADLDHEVHVYAPAPGEGAENGIASCREGAVILTNLACYLLRANGGVEVVWRTPYDSVGAKDSREGAATTGGGLAWGGGCSPSLSRELVFFTDNLETVSLMAVDIHTGEVAASHPVIDELPANMPVSVENSAIVYDHGNGRVSTIVCNWFGAGSPNLAKPDSDSSIQSYENIYDRNWLLKGNCMIMPGVERVDTIRTADGWTMKSVWCRDDLSDTSMMKLSTATGYIYGFVQDVDSGMWQYIVLDFDTGKTVLTVDVASLYGYNNMAIGMYAGPGRDKHHPPPPLPADPPAHGPDPRALVVRPAALSGAGLRKAGPAALAVFQPKRRAVHGLQLLVPLAQAAHGHFLPFLLPVLEPRQLCKGHLVAPAGIHAPVFVVVRQPFFPHDDTSSASSRQRLISSLSSAVMISVNFQPAGRAISSRNTRRRTG